MKELQDFNLWLENVDDSEVLCELNNIKNNYNEIYDRFHKFLNFGTAGLRGVMGAGTNRMNIYTLRTVSQGFANYLNDNFENPSIAISYDSRNNSKIFAYCTAEVMAANNIRVYITKELAPTPYLSFCVRNLNCNAGVMITASHNTSEYNGYKCYNSDGSQITEKISSQIYNYFSKLNIFKDIEHIDFNQALNKNIINFIDNSTYDKYKKIVLDQNINKPDYSNINVMYTPLNGTGYKFVQDVLTGAGIKNLHIVPEQANPDGNFPTCTYPNPEIQSAFDLAVETCEKLKNTRDISCDIIIATDPDADRLGVCVYHNNKYVLLTGNQIGQILFYYIYESRKNLGILPENPIVIKSFVSTKLIDSMAKHENFQVIDVPTGFKNIADEISKLEKNNMLSRFIFGFEESNGYLCHTQARDKDAVSAALLICEAVAYYKNNNLDLINILDILSQKYGRFIEKTISLNFSAKQIENIIYNLEHNPPKIIKKANVKISSVTKIHKNTYVLKLEKKKGEIIIRPSGTEPKVKLYFNFRSFSRLTATP
ncbi:MAG: phospho-sugar mutase [Clostridia bacterium]|nr:phospho-sugar mutase [Clostridia bacterium]